MKYIPRLSPLFPSAGHSLTEVQYCKYHTTVDDVRRLAEMKLYGAILGKALYTGMLDLKDAIRVAREVQA